MATREEERTRDTTARDDPDEADIRGRLDPDDADDPDPDVVPDCTCEGGIVRL